MTDFRSEPYIEGFRDRLDMLEDFKPDDVSFQTFYDKVSNDLRNVLFAIYDGGYSATAYVFFTRWDWRCRKYELYMVYGSHCSCYGLEGQWEPEAASPETVASITVDNLDFSNEQRAKFAEFKAWLLEHKDEFKELASKDGFA